MIDELYQLLNEAFQPNELTIADNSHQHVGHGGYQEGEVTHIAIDITAASFASKSRVEQQRMVYAVLDGAFAGALHAVELRIRVPQTN